MCKGWPNRTKQHVINKTILYNIVTVCWFDIINNTVLYNIVVLSVDLMCVSKNHYNHNLSHQTMTTTFTLILHLIINKQWPLLTPLTPSDNNNMPPIITNIITVHKSILVSSHSHLLCSNKRLTKWCMSVQQAFYLLYVIGRLVHKTE